MARTVQEIEIDRVFMYEENPRHEPLQTQEEIIEHLCKDEQVYNLARSISETGTNPLELLGVVTLKDAESRGSKLNYEVWEGNRRICAIKLLNDPDLAPPHLRKDITRLAAEYIPIKKVHSVIFDDHEDLKNWMAIIHGGQQDGVGRKNWDAQQKQRHFGTGRNKVALAILDASEEMGLISKEERARKITTAQRYLNSNVVREALGIDVSNPEDITFNRPLKDFQIQMSRFINDLKEGVGVTSRNNREQIDTYGRKLARNPDVSSERIQPVSLKNATTAVPKTKRKAKAKKPRKVIHLEFEKELSEALERIKNRKLENLYYSLCDVHIEHVQLLTIGVWAFVESLTALAGKSVGVDFVGYFSKQRLAGYGYNSGKTTNPILDALTRIQRNGNTTKHHEIAGNFDGKQLANDLATITPVLLKTIETIPAKK